jgi:hypothetical protein
MKMNLSPSEVRRIFPENLKTLVSTKGSVTSVSKDLGIHRSQFNRFIVGDSFPKPDILYKICQYFQTDARILLEPLDVIKADNELSNEPRLLSFHPELSDYMQVGDTSADTNIMPTGFYKFTRGSFIQPHRLQTGLIYVYEKGGVKFSKGYTPRALTRMLGMNPNSRIDREFKGAVFGTDRGAVSMSAHHNSKSCSFTYLDICTFVEKTFLVGYCARTMPDTNSYSSIRKVVYEKISDDFKTARGILRSTGFTDLDDIPRVLHPFLLGTVGP